MEEESLNDFMAIDEFAAKVSSSTRTIRYYQARGLLQRPERAARAIQMVPNPTIPVAVVTWDDGSASVVKLSAKGGDVLWSV